jgi:hypothetical protein
MQRAYLQLDIAEATLKQRDQIFALTRDRNAAGVDSLLEVKQAESALPATREQIAQWKESIELSRHQLAALLGQGPDRGLAIARPDASAGASVALPSTLPAELVGRRPDLTAQRRARFHRLRDSCPRNRSPTTASPRADAASPSWFRAAAASRRFWTDALASTRRRR